MEQTEAQDARYLVDMTSATASDLIGQRIREARGRRGWSGKDLARRCAEIGAPEMTASVIANIETGRRSPSGRRRREVSVDELLVLAYALEVQPLLLFVPLSGSESLQITPTTELDVIDALAWIDGGEAGIRLLAGESRPETDEDRERWRRIRASSRPLNTLRAFWLRVYLLWVETADGADRERRELQSLEDLALDNPAAIDSLRAIAGLVDNLASQGLAPPPLPRPLAQALRDGNLLQVAQPDELLIADEFRFADPGA